MASPIIESGIGHTLLSFDRCLARPAFWIFGVAIPWAVMFLVLELHGLVSRVRFGGNGVVDGILMVSALMVLLVSYVTMLWVSLAAGTKRLHDRDISGWWIWIALVPFAGSFATARWRAVCPMSPRSRIPR